MQLDTLLAPGQNAVNRGTTNDFPHRWWGSRSCVLLRPLGKPLVLTMLEYPSKVARPEAIEPEIPDAEPTGQEMELVKAQIARRFDIEQFKDAPSKRMAKSRPRKAAQRKRKHG